MVYFIVHATGRGVRERWGGEGVEDARVKGGGTGRKRAGGVRVGGGGRGGDRRHFPLTSTSL